MANKEMRIRLPEDIHDEVKKVALRYLYKTYKKYKPIYEIIMANPTTPLGRLQSQLRKGGVTPSKAKMKEIAEMCDLPYTL